MYAVLHKRKATLKLLLPPGKKKKINWDSELSMYAFSVFLSYMSLLLKIFLWNCSTHL